MSDSAKSLQQGTTGATGAPGAAGADAKLRNRFFENFGGATRLDQGGGNSGNQGLGNSGLTQATGATASSYCYSRAYIYAGVAASLFTGNSSFDTVFTIGTMPTTGSALFGVGDVTISGADCTYTENHYGFKIIVVAGVATLYATNGNGTTETATSIQTLAVNTPLFLYAKMIDATNIKYYVNGALVATHTTNLPTGSPVAFFKMGISNKATANDFQTAFAYAAYERDATP